MTKPAFNELIREEHLRTIEDAVASVELLTSAEVRVHFEEHCNEDVLDHAAFIFGELNMHRTAVRNGVLVYVAPLDHKMAVIGDAGINARVQSGFWDEVRDIMLPHFQRNAFSEGLAAGLELIGTELSRHFPRENNDQNELPNTVSIGKSK
ncbi:MAG: hypothetical protein RL220_46 [Bacteroidota bacterium]|jgi:uncharacterized membrane protein